DAGQIDQQQPPRINVGGIEAIEVYGLFAIVGAHAHEITLVAHHIDQLELLEHGRDGRKALAHFWPRLDGDTQRRGVVKNEAQERVPNQSLAPIRYEKIDRFYMCHRNLAFLVTQRHTLPDTV